MIQLLFSVIGSEMLVIVSLLFRNPLRKLVIMILDRVKRGRGPIMLSTVAATISVVLTSSVYSMIKIQQRTTEPSLNPTDQVLMSRHLLESSLMGFVLFLGLMIDRLHHYIRELRILRKAMETAKKQNQAVDDRKGSEVKAMAEEINTLKKKIEKLEPEYEAKVKETKAAKDEASALKKQSEGLLLEYDRLVEDNQHLRSQLESIRQN
ncbi:hypothetical protein ACFE04_018375 [Oxalis oulophora]